MNEYTNVRYTSKSDKIVDLAKLVQFSPKLIRKYNCGQGKDNSKSTVSNFLAKCQH